MNYYEKRMEEKFVAIAEKVKDCYKEDEHMLKYVVIDDLTKYNIDFVFDNVSECAEALRNKLNKQ